MPGSRDQRSPYAARTSPTSHDDPVVQWLLEGDPADPVAGVRDRLDAPEAEWSTDEPGPSTRAGALVLALRAPTGCGPRRLLPGYGRFAQATADALAGAGHRPRSPNRTMT